MERHGCSICIFKTNNKVLRIISPKAYIYPCASEGNNHYYSYRSWLINRTTDRIYHVHIVLTCRHRAKSKLVPNKVARHIVADANPYACMCRTTPDSPKTAHTPPKPARLTSPVESSPNLTQCTIIPLLKLLCVYYWTYPLPPLASFFVHLFPASSIILVDEHVIPYKMV